MIRRAMVAVVAVLALVPAACGVPDSGPVVVVGNAPPAGLQEDPPLGVAEAPPAPTDARDPAHLVRLFFSAAAGDHTTVADRVTPFFAPGAKKTWQRGSLHDGVSVVRLDSVSPQPVVRGVTPVRVTGAVIGVLDETGTIAPHNAPYRYDFQVIATDDTWLIVNPPAGVLMSDGMLLGARYDRATLYFPSPDGSVLVPDLRYLPRSLPNDKLRNLLVDWLLAGPSAWLAPAVTTEFPRGTARRGNVILEQRRVVVNLSTEAAGVDRPDLLSAQLAWTLRPLMPETLEIRIDDRPLDIPGTGKIQSRDRWRDLNAAAKLARPATGYAITGGRIRALPAGAPVPAALVAGAPTGGVLAATVTGHGAAAIVARSGEDRQTLFVRGPNGPMVEVAAAKGVGAISRPSWVPGASVFLAAVDGRLLEVRPDGSSVEVTTGLGAVTAVAVAPDGYRVALIAGGRAWVAPLRHGEDAIVLGSVRLAGESVSGATGVSWTREERVVIAGRRGGAAGLWEATVDGAVVEGLPAVPGNAVPVHVTAQTDDPSDTRARGPVLFATDGRVYEVFSTSVVAPGGSGDPPAATAPFYTE